MSDWLDVAGKKVIVTGGSSGIGASIIDELLGQGVVVANFDLQPGKVAHENLHYFQTDISDRKQVEENVAKVEEALGQIDGLVNNAGINVPRLLVDEEDPHGPFELSDAVFDKMLVINQKGLFLMTQAVARTMVKNQAGVIINMSSECGLEGSEGQSPYAATKAAVNSFTRSWSKELGKQGIRVVGIAPGIMEETGLRTEAYETALAYTRGITVEDLRKNYDKTTTIPLGRSGKLSEVADLVCYYLSDRSSYITGVTTNVAGGKTRG
ncbi:SDR family oxidoreductase [Enterococcus gilvus]|uniref:Short chain dehydrogenase/reductase family oxidoreductase n=1 Tax=Enterococcus gilvus ATCC BAA-350 TaxID=1158614 RepID=R2V856_9ENTE|nr:SDR family oxidoreductase [Enterococcus gilvus]EOI53910.1 short chain dehydrogenase/reductase family oxidoreductase [Enterococcus gilvus ATCC BAA-350]EOW80815.1 short chain dehydrogenase/reductase family oxidoreductase [Enterococcus gilvus ATCC BAA-350]MBS5821898.1 SDR family oxidoreductase [Enterococcus gilvus]OJG39611.1 short chain dehydrogenase/reductase family oxidoreductase [Enterococcus gilvus]